MQNRTYRYMENKPLQPFGYGLSYTQYEYSDIAFTEEKPDINAGVTVQFTVTNTGERDGMETVQVYVKVKMVGTPNAQLKGIKKVYLKAGESRQCQIYLPREAFMLYDKNGNNKIAGREYEISIGGSQPDTRSEELTGHKTEHLRCFYHEALKTEEQFKMQKDQINPVTRVCGWHLCIKGDRER